MTPATATGWGDRVERRQGDGLPFLVYEPRPRSLRQVLAAGGRWSGRDHLVHDGRRMRFEEVVEAASRAAGQLVSHGVVADDRVLLLGGNSIAWVVAFWAIVEAGAIVVLGNAWWNAPEVEHAVRLTDPRLTLAPAPLLERLPGGRAAIDLDELEQAGAAGLPPGGAPPDPGDEDDPAVILFTSGSTGLPKGAVLPHRALIAMQQTLLHLTGRLPDRLPTDHPREVTLVSGPLFHVGGVQGLLRTWLLGGTLVFLRDRFDPAEVVDLIETERVHRWGGVPTMVSRVLDLPGLDGRDLTSIRSLTLGGSAVAPELVERVRARFPNASKGISQIYGQSEAGGTLTAASGRDLVERPGTVGRALPVVELRIDGAGADGVGEVLARTAGQMSGYWGQPEDDPFTPDGWLRTGDLGHLDADGYLYLTGRSKDIIIRGGENIAAPHVESALLGHDQVRDAAVIGLPDPDLGEVVGAIVVVAPDSTVTVAELLDVAKGRLAYFAVPTRWWVRTTGLPVNATGKVDKRALQRVFPAAARTDERTTGDPA